MEEKATTFKNLVSKEYPGHKKKVNSVAWNCSGTKLASGSFDHTARIWSIGPHGHWKVKEVELKGHTDIVDQMCWDPKHSDVVATAAGDKTVRLWDARSGKCSQQAELSGENINITYKPDGTHIAVGNKKGSIELVHKIHHVMRAWVIGDQDEMRVGLDAPFSKCFPIRFYASQPDLLSAIAWVDFVEYLTGPLLLWVADLFLKKMGRFVGTRLRGVTSRIGNQNLCVSFFPFCLKQNFQMKEVYLAWKKGNKPIWDPSQQESPLTKRKQFKSAWLHNGQDLTQNAAYVALRLRNIFLFSVPTREMRYKEGFVVHLNGGNSWRRFMGVWWRKKWDSKAKNWIWKLLLFAIPWNIWKERNERIFRNKCKDGENSGQNVCSEYGDGVSRQRAKPTFGSVHE